MQRKSTKQSRGANAKEKAFMGWVKRQPCSFCGSIGQSIVDHAKGSSFKQNKILIGHVYINSKCLACDTVVTQGARSNLFEQFGFTDSDATLQQMKQYEVETGVTFSDDILNAIHDVYAVNDDVTDWLNIL